MQKLKNQFIMHAKPWQVLLGFYGLIIITGIIYRVING